MKNPVFVDIQSIKNNNSLKRSAMLIRIIHPDRIYWSFLSRCNVSVTGFSPVKANYRLIQICDSRRVCIKRCVPIRKKIPNLFAFLQGLKMPSVILINSTSFKIPGKYQQNFFEFLLGLLDYRVHLCK